MKNNSLKHLNIALLCAGMLSNGYTTAKEKKQEVAPQRIKASSGWSYEIITAAPAGAKAPKKGDRVSVHYTGWLDEKKTKKFDSSVDRKKQFEFNLGRSEVIRGWDEAVADMKVGEKRLVIIPSDLAYGNRGAGNFIPPHATLYFEIELITLK